MSCPRCQTLPLTPDARGNLLLTFAVRELLDKMVGFLDDQSARYQTEQMVVTLPDASLADFLALVRNSGFFNQLEYQGISALLLAADETLTFQAFTRARTLDRWFGLVDSQRLLDILEHKRFTAWFQPILASDTGVTIGYEALLRGRNADGTLMFPGEIFRMATENDLLFQVDRQAREMALHCAAAAGIVGRLFINFVPTAIYDPVHCLRSTVGWAKSLGFDPSRIVFEVVETERIVDIDHLKRILDFYRSAGYQVALDDVGSGYASLNLLTLLQPDIIKIDMDLVRGIHADQRRQAVFKALVGIARDLKILVLAEGVETEDELAYVVREGADMVQGYLFARPAPIPSALSIPSSWPVGTGRT
ncbi:EAL domain-containing protein [Thiocystis violascens]|uniref:EAL domain-containing protein n=1 Tax=Thiocystis violascens (strain ATCC 17096 / DSM 198 / 6111) TaxID=765911 RepID=I3YD51_THIV6|nr:EAL domain-containing protein [Thiocystis violascens]AFL74919.1 EAL domain-containing protein [Thiocystis violascens DSM 198]